ncbi:Ig-like domain-containing protein [Brevibacillus laterosporus]|uniref:Ig-like domain-containing protein n=1 Tax=Brevibacillus laterosporus TaxID=1465 RepID=UPI000CE4A46B|nr:Ig-like domain-containing protein [Brevibacillus laterosporus]MED1662786.1 Ig-like domain-containing protein [Brevibacillus laterosporus]MED1669088.1 Ig-like domain-containing protein [Brevibacillus laterosporus]MED1720563.1 Ig-like domain-containing protein [Brevibacillus laterosporus]PPA88367.1 scaffolding protein [Brevibacillus laterosporus]
MIQKKAIFHVLVSTSLLTSLGLPSYVSAAVEENLIREEQGTEKTITADKTGGSKSHAKDAGIGDGSVSQGDESVVTVGSQETKTEKETVVDSPEVQTEESTSQISTDGSQDEESTSKDNTLESQTEQGESQVVTPTPQPNPENINLKPEATTIEIESVEAIPDSTYSNRTFAFNFNLPSNVTVQLSNGKKIELYVRWSFDQYNPDDVNSQTFTAVGALRETSWSSALPEGITNTKNMKATAKITVSAAKQITSVNQLADIVEKENGTSFYQLGLPNSVDVILDDNTTQSVGVSWEHGDYDENNPNAHTVQFLGNLGDRSGLPTGIANSDGVKAKIKVSFKDARTISSLKPVEINNVLSGTPKTEEALGLPEQVEAELSDGSKVQVPIEWNVDDSAYDPNNPAEQNFNVAGTLKNIPAGLKNPSEVKAEAKVKVAAALQITSIDPVQVAQVPNGISKTALAFYLPKQANVTLSNGKTEKVDVTWELAASNYDPANEKQQAVEVRGKLVHLPAGVVVPSQKAIANISVNEMRYVQSLNPIPDITGIVSGTNASLEALHLPKQVSVALSDGNSMNVDVQWDLHNISYEKGNDKAQDFTVTGTLINLPVGVKGNNVEAKVNVKVEAKIKPTVNVGVTMSDVSVERQGRDTTEVLGEYFLPLSGDVTGSNGQPINGPGTALLVLQMYINNEEVNTVDYLGRQLALNHKLYVGWKNENVLAEIENVLKAALLHHPEGRNYEVITSSSPAGIIIKQKTGTGNNASIILNVIENGKGSAVEGLTWGDLETRTEGSFGIVGQKAKFSTQVNTGAHTAGILVVHIADGKIDKQIAVPVEANDDTAAVAQKVANRLAADYGIVHAYAVNTEGSKIIFDALQEGTKELKVEVKTVTDTGSKPDVGTGGEEKEKEKEKEPEKDRDKEPDKDRDKEPEKDRDKEPEKDRDKEPEKDRDKEPGKDRDKEPGKDRDKEPEKDRDKEPEKDKDKEPEKDKDKEKKPDKETDKDKDRDKNKNRDRGKDRGKDRDRERDTDKNKNTATTTTTNNQGTQNIAKVENRDKSTAKTFGDLQNHKWAQNSIELLNSKGIILGTSDQTFTPKAAMKGGDFALILMRMFDLKSDVAGNTSDVPQNSYYSEAVTSLMGQGIIQSFEGEQFNPDTPITRQDLMVILYQAMIKSGMELKKGEVAELNRFADSNKVKNNAKEAISALIAEGIVKGDGRNLNPTAHASRAEIAVLLEQVLHKIPEKK